jgi:hypothetical protein
MRPDTEDIRATPSSLADAAKWGAVGLAAITFSALLADWYGTHRLMLRLGVPDLAHAQFASDELHASGALILLLGSLVLGASAIIAYVVFHWLGTYSMTEAWLKLARATLPVVVWPLVAFVAAVLHGQENLPVLFALGSVPSAVVTWWLWLGAYAERAFVRRGVRSLAVLFGGAALALSVLIDLPEDVADRLADSVLNGRVTFPPVSVVTEEPCFFSAEVISDTVPTGEYVYTTSLVTQSVSGAVVYSLQYVGADEEAHYVLDLASGSVHAVPKNIVRQLSFPSLGSSPPGADQDP